MGPKLGFVTGLCGPLFKNMSETLVGVDLSSEMVEHARARGVYDELYIEEITGTACVLLKYSAAATAAVTATPTATPSAADTATCNTASVAASPADTAACTFYCRCYCCVMLLTRCRSSAV